MDLYMAVLITELQSNSVVKVDSVTVCSWAYI